MRTLVRQGAMGLCVVALLVAVVTAQDAGKTRLVNGFDNYGDLAGIEFQGDTALVKDKELITQGEGALKLMIRKGKGTSQMEVSKFTKKEMLAGWTDYDVLLIDVRNQSERDVTMTFRFDDDDSTNYQTRANIEKVLRSGPNTVKFLIKEMLRENGDKLSFAALKRLVFFVSEPDFDADLIFDNMRLEKLGD